MSDKIRLACCTKKGRSRAKWSSESREWYLGARKIPAREPFWRSEVGTMGVLLQYWKELKDLVPTRFGHDADQINTKQKDISSLSFFETCQMYLWRTQSCRSKKLQNDPIIDIQWCSSSVNIAHLTLSIISTVKKPTFILKKLITQRSIVQLCTHDWTVQLQPDGVVVFGAWHCFNLFLDGNNMTVSVWSSVPAVSAGLVAGQTGTF